MKEKLVALLLVSTLTGNAFAANLSQLKGESVSVSPNGAFALWCRITKWEWIKKSWKFPVYPFAVLISGHRIPFKWGLKNKCTIVDKDQNDLFEWPYGGYSPVWSTDGNSVSLDNGKSFRALAK